MEQRALELQEQDDQDDWFGNPRNTRNARVGSGTGSGKKDAKIRIGRAWKSDDPPLPPPSQSPSHRRPSLLERLDDGGHRRSHGRERDRDRDHDRDRDRERNREREWDRDRGRDRNRNRNSDRDRDRGRAGAHGHDEGGGGHDGGFGLRIRGLASSKDPSRHEREGRRQEELRDGDRQEENRSRDREPWASRDDRGPQSPQYRGGYAR
jgi:hypothetical protein